MSRKDKYLINQEKEIEDSINKLKKKKIEEYDTDQYLQIQEKQALKSVIDNYISEREKEKAEEQLPVDDKFFKNIQRSFEIIKSDVDNGGENSVNIIRELYKYIRNNVSKIDEGTKANIRANVGEINKLLSESVGETNQNIDSETFNKISSNLNTIVQLTEDIDKIKLLPPPEFRREPGQGTIRTYEPPQGDDR
jgi:hypothetical protein